MRQCFRLPGVVRGSLYVVSAWAVFWLGPWAIAFLKAAWQDGSVSYEVAFATAFLFFVYALFEVWRGLETCVIVTDAAIILQKPFYSHEILWQDLSEVGAYRPRYASRVSYWTVYLKARSSGEKKWDVNPFRLRNGSELVALLFEKAPHARFVKFVNDSWVPFFSRAKALPWDQHEDIGSLWA